jgi:nitrous oxidase accessory protein NosD
MRLPLVCLLSACAAEAPPDIETGSSPLSAARPLAADPCPAPTWRRADGRCVIDRDVILTSTLELGDGMTLDCQGGRLLPAAAGSGTTLADYVPSQPEVAVAIIGKRGASVVNCAIGSEAARFDFGVVVAGGKRPAGGHTIAGSDLHVRACGVQILDADDILVERNDLDWTAGQGVVIARDSDGNVVRKNRFTLAGDLPTQYVRANPGTAPELGVKKTGVMVGNPVHLPIHFNLFVNGRLLQFPNYVEPDGYGWVEDTVIEGNRLSLPGLPGPAADPGGAQTRMGIYILMASRRAHVRGNEVREAAHGLRMAGVQATPLRAQRCVSERGEPTSRFCLSEADCALGGVDAGACPAAIIDVLDARVREPVLERNRLYGPFNDPRPIFRAAIAGGFSTVDALIRENLIEGTGTEAGISLQRFSLETGSVTGNRISGARWGLLFEQGTTAFFGAQIARNDILGSTVAGVGTLGAWSFPAELSVDGAGNHWGHREEPCFRETDSTSALIRDSHASCQPLTALSAEED